MPNKLIVVLFLFFNAGEVSAQQSEITITPKTAPRYIAVKTNLAAWAGTLLNVAADVQVSRHLSLELPVVWCPWSIVLTPNK